MNKYVQRYLERKRARNGEPDAARVAPPPSEGEGQTDGEGKGEQTPNESPAGSTPAIVPSSNPDSSPPVVPPPISDTVMEIEFKESSNIRAAKLDRATGVLSVAFANGSVYRFAGVTAEQMVAWQSAKSAGGWFHHNIKSQPAKHPVVPQE